MLKLKKIVPIVAGCMFTSVSYGALYEHQTFDDAASAAAAGWTELNTGASDNNFGWKNSNFTGNNPEGEAGGRFERAQVQTYYADTTLGGTLNLETAFGSTGEFTFVSRGADYNSNGFDMHVGHFDAANTVQNASIAGFSIAEPASTQDQNDFRVFLTLSDNTGTKIDSATMSGSGPDVATSGYTRFHLTEGVQYKWIFTYDPTLGAFGQASLQFTYLDGTDRGTITADLTEAIRINGASMNTFGWENDQYISANGAATNWFDAYIDDVYYSSNVPEPATLSLLAAGSVCLLHRRRSR